ncbi:MAG: hydrogenase maturation nickel metallochaperone HypA [Phycisphaerales bacterium]
MHEAAVTEAIVEQVRRALPAGSRLEVCRIEVGELEHLDAEVMGSIWHAMTAETDLAGAMLEIERVALRVRCGACAGEFVPEDKAILVCPACGSVRPEVLAGSGITLRSLEVEEGG